MSSMTLPIQVLLQQKKETDRNRALVAAMVASIERGDAVEVERLLGLGVDGDACDEENGWSMSMWACRGFPRQKHEAWMDSVARGRARCLAALIKDGADAQDGRSQHGWTCAHWAARDGMGACLLLLRDAGVDMSRRNEMGSTPLDMACWMGNHKIATVLVDVLGRDLVDSQALCSAMENACASGSVETGGAIARACMSRGMDVELLVEKASRGGASCWLFDMRRLVVSGREHMELQEFLGKDESSKPARARM